MKFGSLTLKGLRFLCLSPGGPQKWLFRSVLQKLQVRALADNTLVTLTTMSLFVGK